MTTRLRSNAALLLLIVLVGMVGLWPASASAGDRGSSVTTELSGGVTCTTYATVVGYGLSPKGNHTLHQVICNKPVARLQVNGAQTMYSPSRYYPRSAVCYNTNSCSVDIEVWQFTYGEWLVTTSGHVGTTSDQFYYGIANTAYHTIDCSTFYCVNGPPLD
ncbi:MAG TPA: hypothetical protein VFS21_35275 [Roseiflexaceae bacterium]|nr:hypothetical protein [Roseiflexaceae bacterium]